ncbi:hypothetical protein Vadar_025642 [Vaccinium darrowii]|uniref:Uncharacterized protein n=1 Tax=Vaccinium darrowii TaxID=229202 RepID=A0ACB7YQU2_9ERIC|nr:hypothetical protein Vadar_025642 [Vaccinium darrowii]
MNSIMRLYAIQIIGFFFLAIVQVGCGQGFAPSPAPNTNIPSNDGTAIDQGIAYVLLLFNFCFGVQRFTQIDALCDRRIK